MAIRAFAATFLLLSVLAAKSVPAQDLAGYLNRYFTGSAIQYGSGTGVTSSNPRVDLTIHYCASGNYFASGRSCRRNVVASGFQCTPYQDAGRWRIATQGGRGFLQYQSNRAGTGSIALVVRQDGTVGDPRGNVFRRAGRAQCR